MGLSGLGDLVLTATGDLSRNRRVGLLLAAGQPLAAILADWAMSPRACYSAPRCWRARAALGVEMPITEAVVEVLEGRCRPAQAHDAR